MHSVREIPHLSDFCDQWKAEKERVFRTTNFSANSFHFFSNVLTILSTFSARAQIQDPSERWLVANQVPNCKVWPKTQDSESGIAAAPNLRACAHRKWWEIGHMITPRDFQSVQRSTIPTQGPQTTARAHFPCQGKDGVFPEKEEDLNWPVPFVTFLVCFFLTDPCWVLQVWKRIPGDYTFSGVNFYFLFHSFQQLAILLALRFTAKTFKIFH